ncbi:uncharacterized protein [Dasypus novemcinctus]|uniref:uncharacterized protein isoform X1 n=2 Tax=Dasypus novemcinctus TaxID=9361 RepID=UPI00265D8242|nr:uncharacterized protein LOC131273219 isoform X2 [Dasypus novemcinctus]
MVRARGALGPPAASPWSRGHCQVRFPEGVARPVRAGERTSPFPTERAGHPPLSRARRRLGGQVLAPTAALPAQPNPRAPHAGMQCDTVRAPQPDAASPKVAGAASQWRAGVARRTAAGRGPSSGNVLQETEELPLLQGVRALQRATSYVISLQYLLSLDPGQSEPLLQDNICNEDLENQHLQEQDICHVGISCSSTTVPEKLCYKEGIQRRTGKF